VCTLQWQQLGATQAMVFMAIQVGYITDNRYACLCSQVPVLQGNPRFRLVIY
jgi:hypothetical protein